MNLYPSKCNCTQRGFVKQPDETAEEFEKRILPRFQELLNISDSIQCRNYTRVAGLVFPMMSFETGDLSWYITQPGRNVRLSWLALPGTIKAAETNFTDLNWRRVWSFVMEDRRARGVGGFTGRPRKQKQKEEESV